jgi:FlaA1/EpsC-like NDP-sugar epimerase
VGVGDRAERVLREIQAEDHALHVVGLVDDAGGQVHPVCGVPVLGTVDDLPKLAGWVRADLAIIALEPGALSAMSLVVDQCIAAGLEFKTLPSLPELVEGAAAVNQLRNVRIDDLLGRPPVSLDLTLVKADLHNRVILLTGAAGSIGSELTRQIAQFGPKRLVLLDQSESDLYFLHLSLQEAYPTLDLVPVICDITNQSRLAQVCAHHRPEYVIHTAAYKHASLLESNVLEAIRNNVLGTLLVATTAVRYGATKMLLISSDKAISPSSVMGATKRIAERIIFGLPNLHRSGTDFRAVRFGDVLTSKGSLIPLFERQLAAGGPITVSHPLVTRHFIPITEAAELVLQAGSLPETAGTIAMLDMGEPVRILDVAEKLIRFSGRVPERDIAIVFTGLQANEKLTEERISTLEDTVPTSAPQIRISQTTESAGPELMQKLSRLFAFLDAGDRNGVLATLCELVPECVPPLRDQATRPAIPLSTAHAMEVWGGLADPSEIKWRERRQVPTRPTSPPDLKLIDRRGGVACRRKTPRVGGRRRTDVGALLATGSSAR